MSKVTAVKVTKSGNIAARPQSDEPSALQLCQDKWEHLRADVKDKRWAECPPEMVGDFMRAMAQYFKQNFHDDAVMKALQLVCSSVFKDLSAKGFELTAHYSGSPASAILSVAPQPEDKTNIEMETGHSVTFDIATTATTDAGVRAALGQWAEENTPETRIIFDPLTSLPNSDIVALVKQVEEKVGTEDLLVMTTTALTLLLWKEFEKTNAETGEFTIRGLYNGKRDVRPGEKMVAAMNVRHLDSTLDPPVSEEQNVYSITTAIGKVKI